MRPTRMILLSIAGLAALAVAGAVLLYGAVQTSWFERKAGEWLSRRLDTTVTVGSLAVGYFPALSVTAGDVVIAERRAAGAPALVEIGQARAELPWRTVFGKASSLSRLRIDAPRLHLAVDAGGHGNWEPLVDTLASLAGDEPAAWSLGTLETLGGTLGYTDARDGASVELTAIEFTATGIEPGAPAPFKGRLAGHGPDFVMHASLSGVGVLDPDHDAYAARWIAWHGWLGGWGLATGGVELAGSLASAQADLAAGTATLDGIGFEGLGLRATGSARLQGLRAEPRVAFRFGTEPFAPRALANSLNRPLPATTDPAALARASVTVQGEYAGGELTLDRIAVQLDDTRIDGRARLPAAGPPWVRLDLDRMDLDRYLPPATASPGTPQATLESLLGELSALDVDAELKFGEAKSSGLTARGLHIVLEPNRPERQP